MNTQVSDNTKAILLLTAPLLLSKGEIGVKPLSTSEYNKLSRCLAETKQEPGDLLGPSWRNSFDEFQIGLDVERIGSLLERGFLLSQAIERWQARSIWVVSRADAEYPQRLRARLRASAPPILYGCGDMELLDGGGLAIVGSRNVSEELLCRTEDVGRLAAESECAVISGAARGVDRAAMSGALNAQGTTIGVLSSDLERASINRDHREILMDGHLVLVSPYDPKTRFIVGYAMQRNKLIYALADAALVMESDYKKGGTWAGAAEQLDKLRYVQVYTRSEGDTSPGLKGLIRKGALEWPNPRTPDEFRAALAGGVSPQTDESIQRQLPLPVDTIPAE